MPTITKVRGDRLRIRQCFRDVTVVQAPNFEARSYKAIITLERPNPSSGAVLSWWTRGGEFGAQLHSQLGGDVAATLYGYDSTLDRIYGLAGPNIYFWDAAGGFRDSVSNGPSASSGEIDTVNRLLYYGAGDPSVIDSQVRVHDIAAESDAQVIDLGGNSLTGVAYDPFNALIYAACEQLDQLRRTEASGTLNETLTTFASGSALFCRYHPNGYIYYNNRSAQRIERFHLASGDIESIISSDPNGDFALDILEGQIYYVKSDGKTVARADLDGSNSVDLFEGPNISVRGLMLIDREYP